MHHENSAEYLIAPEPQMKERRGGTKKRNSRHMFVDIRNDFSNQSQKQYFPESSTRKDNDMTPGNKSSRSVNQHPLYRRFASEASRGITVNSSRRTMKSYQSELQKEIQRLNSQISEKDREIKGQKAAKGEDKIKQNQVIELYRVINFYEGKLKTMENQLKLYEEKLVRIGRECDEGNRSKKTVLEVVSLFESLRHENEELSGEISEKNYEIGNLSNKLKKLQFKYYSLNQNKMNERKQPRKLQTKKQKCQHGKKKFFATVTRKQKMEQYGNFQSKINHIQSNLQFLIRENEKLQNQITEKDERIQHLETKLQEMKKKDYFKETANNEVVEKKTIIKYQKPPSKQELIEKDQDKGGYHKNDPLCQVVTLPKAFLRQIKKPQSKIEEKDYSFQIPIKNQIFRKLKFHLMSEEMSYNQLIKVLSDQNFNKQKLEDEPFGLSEQQADWIHEYLTILWEKVRERQSEQNINQKVRDELRRKISSYENVTYRKENNLKIQITNQFMNREKEFLEMMKEEGEPQKMNYNQAMKYFAEWGLSAKQLDYIGKASYEQTDQCQYIDLIAIQSLFLQK